MKSISAILIMGFVFLTLPYLSWAEEDTLLVHLKTDLKKDDAQICVAYNVIWAAIEDGLQVNVLIDASAVNTYKKGWRGKDKLEGYKMPESLRNELARQFEVSLDDVPKTYGEYLKLLHEKGAKFYINGAMLVVSKISRTYGDMSRFSVDFFTPVTLKEMIDLIKQAGSYIAY